MFCYGNGVNNGNIPGKVVEFHLRNRMPLRLSLSRGTSKTTPGTKPGVISGVRGNIVFTYWP